MVLSHADKYKKQKTSDYTSAAYVLCDSNTCERSSSRARLYMHYLRTHVAPESLELLLLLPFLQQGVLEQFKGYRRGSSLTRKERGRGELPKKQQRLPLLKQVT